MNAEEEEEALEIARKYLNIYKATTEQHTVRAMHEYAVKYHRRKMRQINVEDIERLLYYYYCRYRYSGFRQQMKQIAGSVVGYLLGASKSITLMDKIKEEELQHKLKL